MSIFDKLIGNIPQDMLLSKITGALMPHFKDGTLRFIAIHPDKKDPSKVAIESYSNHVIVEEKEYEQLKEAAKKYYLSQL